MCLLGEDARGDNLLDENARVDYFNVTQEILMIIEVMMGTLRHLKKIIHL